MTTASALKCLCDALPVWLAERIYFRILVRQSSLPYKTGEALPLRYAPVSLVSYLPTDLAHRQMAWLGCYERKVTVEFMRSARAGGLCVDVGANIGYYSCLWAASNPINHVIAFEASPPVFAMLEANVRAAGFDARVQLRPMAVGRQNGSIDFDPGPVEQTGWGGISLGEGKNTRRVPMQKLDDLIPGGTAIAMLKIDTEGADTWVLEGATELLRAKLIRRILFEQNSERMNRLQIPADSAEELLRRCGYKVTMVSSGGGDRQMYAYI